MLDPGLEHLHRHGRLWRASLRGRIPGQLAVDVPLLPLLVLLFVFTPTGEWAPQWQVVSLVVAYAVASLVRFEIGSGSTSPLQLIALPLWFAVPPEWLTIVVAGSLILGSLLEHAIKDEDGSILRCFIAGGDAWPTIGPAVVFAIAGSPEATLSAAPVVAAAFGAQFLVDVGIATSASYFVHGIRPSMQLRLLGWVTAVDVALAPIGFLTAVVMVTEPIAFVALLPLVAIIGEFARERASRLEHALQLSSAYRGTAQLMGDVLEADDAYTGGEHTQGVVELAIVVGLELKLEPRQMRDLEFGALLHDIGKLRVPNEIINKPGALDAAEWEIIRKHPQYGQEMLDRVGGAMTDAGAIVRAHHERWDGMGYPDRLRGDDIPLAARIITVCDSFSAMTTKRSYSPAMTHDEGLDELSRCSGTQFDPTVVDALKRVMERDPSLRTLGLRLPLGMSPVAASLGLRPVA